MSLYSEWQGICDQVQEQEPGVARKFWKEYFAAETENYKKILGDYTNTVEGKLSDLAKEFNMDEVTFVGFLDGINSSLKKEIKLDSLKSGSKVTLDIDFETLYYNMLDCKAEWLYTLKEWEPILTPERRKEITHEFRTSKMFVKTAEPGRNDEYKTVMVDFYSTFGINNPVGAEDTFVIPLKPDSENILFNRGNDYYAAFAKGEDGQWYKFAR